MGVWCKVYNPSPSSDRYLSPHWPQGAVWRAAASWPPPCSTVSLGPTHFLERLGVLKPVAFPLQLSCRSGCTCCPAAIVMQQHCSCCFRAASAAGALVLLHVCSAAAVCGPQFTTANPRPVTNARATGVVHEQPLCCSCSSSCHGAVAAAAFPTSFLLSCSNNSATTSAM